MTQEISPAQHAATLVTLASDDTAAIIRLLRGWHAAHLTAVATGEVPGFPALPAVIEGPGHTNVRVADITISPAARQAAARQLELREEGEQIARQALAALGHAYDGTGGWHITAYTTPDGFLGYVNVAHGTAARTTVQLRAEVAEALTLPGQPAGPQASGAAAWATPDPGEAHHASAPDGWVQLLADLRGGADLPPLPGIEARLTAWCLQTCYGRPGEPGAESLDPAPGAPRRDPRLWPCPEETRDAMTRLGLAALERIARELAAEAGLARQVAAALDGSGGWQARMGAAQAAIASPRPLATDLPPAEQALSDAIGLGQGNLVDEALHRSGITGLAQASGDTGELRGEAPIYTCRELIARLLRITLRQRLLPLAEALAAVVPADDHAPAGNPAKHRSIRFATRAQLLRPVITGTAERILAPHLGTAEDTLDDMTALYQASGPAEVDIPLPRPGPWPASDPVGLAEIASRLAVARDTADKWGHRENLPPRDWTVGGRPAWSWETITQWARRTGRWPWH